MDGAGQDLALDVAADRHVVLGRLRMGEIFDRTSPLLRRAAVIVLGMALPSALASCSSRTITRTASHKRLLSLGSWMSAAVTVLSTRTTPAIFELLPPGACQQYFVDVLPRLRPDCADRLVQDRLFRAPAPRQPDEGSKRGRVLEARSTATIQKMTCWCLLHLSSGLHRASSLIPRLEGIGTVDSLKGACGNVSSAQYAIFRFFERGTRTSTGVRA